MHEIKYLLSPSNGPPLTSPSPTAAPIQTLYANSRCTSTYINVRCPILNKRLTHNPIHIRNPNGAIMTSTHKGELDFLMLQPNACHAHIVPALQNCSLLSIGQLCDSGYTVVFDAPTMRVMDGNICVLSGQHNHTNGMWEVEHPKQEERANALGTQTASKLIAFAHATLFSPALATLENALTKGYQTNFPGLSAKLLRNKHPQTSMAMV
jgi:hypothetical protein